MTTPITNTIVRTNAYVQVEGGVNNYTNTMQANLGAALGGEISKGGTFAKAEVGCGTAFKAKTEVGHEFNIGKNMGLELSANAVYAKSNTQNSYNTKFAIATDKQTQTMSMSKKWHDGYKKAGGALMMTFTGKKGNVKAGVEVGAYTNNAPDISTSYNATVKNENGNNQNYTLHHELKAHHSGMYATPKVSAELNLGKTNNWSLVANADRFGGNAGVRFKF